MPDLHDRIDGLFADEPAHRLPTTTHLASGRRALRRRRLATGVATLAVATVLGAGTWALGGEHVPRTDDRDFTATTATPSPAPTGGATVSPADAFAEGCRAGGPAQTYLWAGGPPEVMAFGEPGGRRRAYLRSADGRFWGQCLEATDGQQFTYAFRIKPNRYSNLGYSYSFGPGCADSTPVRKCRSYTITMDARRNPRVAAIEVRLFDGSSMRAEATEGYYLIGRRGRLPGDAAWAPDGMGGELRRDGVPVGIPVTSVRLFDAAGELLAYHGAEQDVNGINPKNGLGVAELEEFPEIQSDRAGE